MAGRYPEAWLAQLRERADIVQTVSAYVPLKKNGQNYWGLCPFHNEKTPSFSVSPEKQMYYCFGCKAGGSVIQFVMEMEHLTFGEAVARLADQLHIPLPEMERDPFYQERRAQRDRLLEANRTAAQFFHQQLFEPQGAAVLEYFKSRGVSDAMITRFGLGAAPDRWDVLTQTLKEKGFSEEELRLAGLTLVHESEAPTRDAPGKPRRVFDMFRNRAMFPIIDQYGNVLGFGGRILGSGQPKYLNTSDTPVFNKRQGVYAANLLRRERGLERVILVEGYMDVIALTQFGVRGVCATLGTALTAEQARLLKRFAPKIFLAYDGDGAGQKAILRGLDILEAEGIPARVLDFPDGLDPDEFIRRDGPEAFEKLPSLSPITYRIRRTEEAYDLSTDDGKIEFLRACAEQMKRLDPVEMEATLKYLTRRTGFSQETLVQQIGVPAPAAPARTPRRVAAPVRREPLPEGQRLDRVRAQEIMISLLASGQMLKDVVSQEDFDDPLLKNLYARLAEGESPAALVESQDNEADRARTARLVFATFGKDRGEQLRMAEECLQSMRRSRIEEELDTIKSQVNLLEGEEKKQAIERVMALTLQLARMK